MNLTPDTYCIQCRYKMKSFLSIPTCVQGVANQLGTQLLLQSLRTADLSSSEQSASNVSW
jgi:hypothetical protein